MTKAGKRESLLSGPMKRYTEHTITSRKALARHLGEVREAGFAVNNEEYGRGLIGVAAPVFDEFGKILAAIGVFTGTGNVPVEDIDRMLAPLVVKAAAWASRHSAPAATCP